MPRTLEDVQQDIEEMEALEGKADRVHVKDILQIELKKLQTEMSLIKENLIKENLIKDETKTNTTANSQNRCVTINLSTYAWDQSAKYMKIYIDIKNVHQLPKENILCNFYEQSLDLTVSNHENKNYQFSVKRLAGNIIPADSYFKVKTDSVLLMLMKKNSTNWEHVSEVSAEKKKDRVKKPTVEDNKDPSEGIMDILKNMYDEGDDEMKRTISKAWYESRNKATEM